MLLSSTFPNHHHHTLPHLQPLLIPPPPLSPFTFEPRPTSPALTALQSTCRSLQTLIASTHHRPHPSTRLPRTPTTLQSPIDLRTSSCDAPASSRINKVDGRNRVRKMQQTRRGGRENLKMGKQRPVVPLRVVERRGGLREGEAPRTPVAQCGALARGDFEGQRREEGGWERRLDDGVDLETRKDQGEAAGRREVDLSRHDEALVGVLLRQLRLQGRAR